MNLTSIYVKKLRDSGLRPTKQRIKICEVLFNTEKTFHFSINDLSNIIQENSQVIILSLLMLFSFFSILCIAIMAKI